MMNQVIAQPANVIPVRTEKHYILYVGHDPYCVVPFPYKDTLRPMKAVSRPGNRPARTSRKNALLLDWNTAHTIANNLANRMYRVQVRDLDGYVVGAYEPAKDYDDMMARQAASRS